MANIRCKNINYIFDNNQIIPDKKKDSSELELLQIKYNKLHLHYQICQILLKVGLDLKSQLSEVNRILTKKFNLLQGNIYFLDRETDELLCCASHSQDMADFPSRLGWTIPIKQPVMIATAIEEKRELISYIDNEIINYCLPIIHQNEVIGAVDLYTAANQKLSFDSLITIKTVCAQLGSHIKEYQIFTKAQQLAITDGLTGLYNHRHFQEYLENEIKSGHKKSTSVTLIIVDVDFFKKINDEHGHLQGDKILLHIANILQKGVRSKDFVARYGGEEFGIVITDTPLPKVMEIAERLRANVENDKFRLNEKTLISATISIGIAFSKYIQPNDREKLIHTADTALYEAKNTGRNRICRNLMETTKDSE